MEVVSLLHQEALTSLFQKVDVPLTEFLFSNIYLFRKMYDFHYVEDGNHVVLLGKTAKGERFLFPIDHPTLWSRAISLAKAHECAFLFPLPEVWWPEVFEYGVTYKDDDSDYVYDIEKIRHYRGRHYDGHRHNVRKLLSDHVVDVVPYSQMYQKEAMFILDEWEKRKNSTEETDKDSCEEGLRLYERLNMEGFLFFVDTKPAGFILGQPLTKNMYTFLFAKSIHPSVSLYQYMYQYFAKNVPQQYVSLNLGEDLGLEGLRKAKQSLSPILLLKKGYVPVPG